LSIEKTESIIIRDVDYRETSKIFEVFTPAHGTMRIVAKGIKRPRQRGTSPPLQTFSHARLTYYQRYPSAMGILSEYEVVEQFAYLRGDLLRLGLAYVFIEVLAKGSAAKSEMMFSLTLRFLRELKSASRPANIAICLFYRLISLLGYRPSLERCTRCNSKTELAGFNIKKGGVLCRNCFRQESEKTMKMELGTLKVLQHCLSVPMAKITSVHLSQRQMESLLALFFELTKYHLDVDIRSERFLQQVLNRSGHTK
jgi:DNA repair protein RecO (recombination protein O)